MQYDVIIVGGGPAGCYLAKLLARKKYCVVLVEQFHSFHQNNFSSAGTPKQTLKDFDIPKKAIAAYWNNITIYSENCVGYWTSKKHLGAVLDFAKLRELYAEDARKYGAKIIMGKRCNKCVISEEGATIVCGKTNISAKVIVDATGPARAVINQFSPTKTKQTTGIGVEYLISTESNISSNTLQYYLGKKWIPKGYAWIFPMQKGRFKIGVCYMKKNRKYPIKKYIDFLIRDHLKLKKFEILDVHGGTVKWTKGRNESFFYKCIIAVGDSCSSINPLGAEGIRHAMKCAEISEKHICDYIDNDIKFNRYEKEAKRYLRWQYLIGERLSNFVYVTLSNRSYDTFVKLVKRLSINTLVDILFYYKFHKVYRFIISDAESAQ